MSKSDNDRDKDRAEQIEQSGSVTVRTEPCGELIHCLTVIGQIEGHYTLAQQNKTTKYEHVIPQLVAIEESTEIAGLLIVLNTVGGDVEAGLAIAELIAGMKKPTVSLVLGGGHSIGVPLAVSARHSFIVPSATMTIHPVRMNGLVLGIPQTFSYFERMQERIVGFVANNSHMSADRMRELMMETGEMATDVGTVLDGEHAVEEGLIDELGGLADAIACLHEMIETEKQNKNKNKNVPQSQDSGCGCRCTVRRSGNTSRSNSGCHTAKTCNCEPGQNSMPPDPDAPGSHREGPQPKPSNPTEPAQDGFPLGCPANCPFAGTALNFRHSGSENSGLSPFSGCGQDTGMTCGGGAYPPEGKDPRWDGTPADVGGNV